MPPAYAGFAPFLRNPQLALWATLCHRLRRLGARSADAR
jgi:hypothetical protein